MKYYVCLTSSVAGTDVPSRAILCECEEESSAHKICTALSHTCDDLTQVYSIVPENKIYSSMYAVICIDTDQIDAAWDCQALLLTHGINSVMCFSIKEKNMICSFYDAREIKYQMILLGRSSEWESYKTYDYQINNFSEMKKESVLSYMINH